jgi:hypothetical protein
MGIPCIGLNGGPGIEHSWAFSFQVATADQAETDRYWNAIVGNGGEESQCGWCKDRWGVNWQITPIALINAFTSSDRAAAKRAFDAMMTMKKIDIAAIESIECYGDSPQPLKENQNAATAICYKPNSRRMLRSSRWGDRR